MNASQKYDLVCRQFGSLHHPNPPMRIDWMPTLAWHFLFATTNMDDVALVYLPVENRIGIATRNKRGYTNTPCCIYDGVNGQEAVDWFNENILELSPKESRKIVLSSMRSDQ